MVIFGAGGPLAAAAARALAPAYRLRLTDVRPLADLEREGRPQSPGAPLPAVLGAPHEATVVDVADPAQVHAACAGMDAVVNCTVVRPDPVQAFRVNTLGAIHVLQAAAAHGIRRVVHTGPLLVLNDRQAGYWWDPEVPDDAPGRPGTWLYAHSKYLGQEAVRAFAEHYGLEVPALYFCNFVNPENARRRSDPPHDRVLGGRGAGAAPGGGGALPPPAPGDPAHPGRPAPRQVLQREGQAPPGLAAPRHPLPASMLASGPSGRGRLA